MASGLVQEWIALGIVAAAASSVGMTAWKQLVAEPLSRWMLKRGRVSAAMRLREQASSAMSACGSSCGTACSSGDRA